MDLREPRGRAKREKREVALALALVVNEIVYNVAVMGGV